MVLAAAAVSVGQNLVRSCVMNVTPNARKPELMFDGSVLGLSATGGQELLAVAIKTLCSDHLDGDCCCGKQDGAGTVACSARSQKADPPSSADDYWRFVLSAGDH